MAHGTEQGNKGFAEKLKFSSSQKSVWYSDGSHKWGAGTCRKSVGEPAGCSRVTLACFETVGLANFHENWTSACNYLLVAAHTDIECACCQIGNYPGGYEPVESEPLYLDMFICDAYQQMYHWKCMKELGCYTDGQRQETDAADTCAGLNIAQKIERECHSKGEFIRVTWMPSWEPEERKETWPKFKQRLLEFEAKQHKPDLS
eukprot:1161401-Pelagomonas_calceolata.AAC.17